MSYDEKYTLCYSCRNSYLNSCEWAESFTPVPGWLAVRDDDHDTYTVVRCPKFKDEAPYGSATRTYHAKKISDISGMFELAAAIIKQACKDYMSAYKVWLLVEDDRSKGEYLQIEKFLRSDYFGKISDLDPDALIRDMKKMVREKVDG